MIAELKDEALKIAIPYAKEFEGCRLRAYRCSAGVWTCGWGETEGVTKDTQWTQEEADAKLNLRMMEFIDGVLEACPELKDDPPYRLAACSLLAYNIGLGAFANSTVCRQTKKGEYEKAANAFLLWVKAGGKVLPGLERRRRVEKALYEGKL